MLVLNGLALNVFDGELISPVLWSGWAILNTATFFPFFVASIVSPFVNIPDTIDISSIFGNKSILLERSKNG